MNKRFCLAGIKRTVKKLDGKIPKWRLLVDKNMLNIGDIYNCVTTQIFGDYEKGLSELSIYAPEYYGLCLDIELDDDPVLYYREYKKLTELWKSVI